MTLDTKMILFAAVFIFSIIQLKAADLDPGDACKFVGLTANRINYIVLKVAPTKNESVEFTIGGGPGQINKKIMLSLATPKTYIELPPSTTDLLCSFKEIEGVTLSYTIVKKSVTEIELVKGESVGLAFVQKEVKVERSDNTKSVSLKIEVIEGSGNAKANIGTDTKVEMVLKDKTDHFLRINENEFDGDLTLEVDMKESNGNVIISHLNEEKLEITNEQTCINGKSFIAQMQLDEDGSKVDFKMTIGTDLATTAKVVFDIAKAKDGKKNLEISKEINSLIFSKDEIETSKKANFKIDIEETKRAHICIDKEPFKSSAKVVQSTISVLLPTLLAFIFCLN